MNLVSSSFPWWISGLVASLGMAGFILFNQQARLNPLHLMVWRGMGVSMLFLPFALMAGLPRDPDFYLAMLVSGVCISFFDYRMFKGVRQFGAGSMSRLQPLGIIFLFVSWVIFSPAYRTHFAALDLLHAGGIIGCLLAAVVALFFVRCHPVGRDVVAYMLPMFIALVGIDIGLKVAITIAPPPQGVMAVPVFNSFVAGIISLVRCYRQEPDFSVRQLFDPAITKFLWLFLGLFVVMSIGKQYSIAAAPSPAYVMALTALNALWIYLFNRFRKISDDSNIKAEAVFVISIIGLILLAA